MRPVFRAVTIGLLALSMVACAPGRVSSVWTAPQASVVRHQSLIVFGVTSSPKVRRAYEDNFVARLRELGVKARPGHELVSDQELGLLVRMTEAVSKSNADAVIITHLITDTHQTRPPALRINQVPAHYHNLVPYFSQVYLDACGPDYYVDFQALRLETNLYDAKSERLIWSGRSEQLDPSSEQTTISEVISEVIAQMSADGYLPKLSSPSAATGQFAQ